MQFLECRSETSPLRIADLILPVFAVILTGWIVGYAGYLPRALSNALIHFAYNIAMPALLIVTIAQEPGHSLINWRFLVAFGGGSLLCFIAVFGVMSMFHREDHAGSLAVAALVDAVLSEDRWSVIDFGVLTPNFQMYGAREIPAEHFRELIWSNLKC